MSTTVDEEVITITAGKPLSQVIRISGAAAVWAELNDLEVRAQLRSGKSEQDSLIVNLHEYMTWEFDGDEEEDEDLVITWVMTGEETRALYALKWGFFKKGYFNLIVSDIDDSDSRALVVPTVTVIAVDTTTTASGDE